MANTTNKKQRMPTKADLVEQLHGRTSTSVEALTAADPIILVSDVQIMKELCVSAMCLYRYTHDPDLGFPPPIKIRQRNFRSRKLLEEWKQKMMWDGVGSRHNTGSEALARKKAEAAAAKAAKTPGDRRAME